MGQPGRLFCIYTSIARGNFRFHQPYLVVDTHFLYETLSTLIVAGPQKFPGFSSQLPLKQARWKAGLMLFRGEKNTDLHISS